ncbi:MAG TPA: WD40 repeat domain-containing protein [Gemmataceae bacterium]|nr:WD40 repeat domain-containing protein [Gemmataceae bacterium]
MSDTVPARRRLPWLIPALAAAVPFLFALAGCQDAKGPTAPAQSIGTVAGVPPQPAGSARSSRTPDPGTPTFAEIQQVYWSGDGKWLVTFSRDCTVTIWDPAEERKLPPAPIGRHTFGSPQAHLLVRVSVAEDLLVDDTEKKFTVRQISTGRTVLVLDQSEHTYGDQFHLASDAKRVVALNAQRQELNVWDVGSGQLIHTKLPKTDRQVAHLIGLSADGAEAYLIFAGIKDGDRYTDLPPDGIYAMNLETGSVKLRVKHRLRADPGFRAVITAERKLFIKDRSWDLKTGLEAGPYPWDHVDAVSPDGRFAASMEADKQDGRRVAIWDVSAKKKIGLLPKLAFRTGGAAIAFSPDGKLVAVGGLRDWKFGSGPDYRSWTPANFVYGKAVHVENRVLVLYDMQALKRVRTLAFPVYPPDSQEVPQVDFP